MTSELEKKKDLKVLFVLRIIRIAGISGSNSFPQGENTTLANSLKRALECRTARWVQFSSLMLKGDSWCLIEMNPEVGNKGLC